VHPELEVGVTAIGGAKDIILNKGGSSSTSFGRKMRTRPTIPPEKFGVHEPGGENRRVPPQQSAEALITGPKNQTKGREVRAKGRGLGGSGYDKKPNRCGPAIKPPKRESRRRKKTPLNHKEHCFTLSR